MNKPTDIDNYIAGFSTDIQEILKQIRSTIKKSAPSAKEVISYQMPAFRLNGILVYFAAYKNHIGFYPTASGIKAYKSKFANYKWSKGAVQFPLDKPIPYDLISEIVKFRVKEDIEKYGSKSPKSKIKLR